MIAILGRASGPGYRTRLIGRLGQIRQTPIGLSPPSEQTSGEGLLSHRAYSRDDRMNETKHQDLLGIITATPDAMARVR